MKNNRRAKATDIIFGVLTIITSFTISGVFIAAAVLIAAAGLITGLFGQILAGILGEETLKWFVELSKAGMGSWGRLILFGIAFGLVWIYIGIKALVRADRAGRYAKAFGNYPRIKVSQIVKDTGRPLSKVSSDLTVMKKRGYFQDMSFDLENKEVVFSPNSEPLPQIGDESLTVYKENKRLPVLAMVAAAITAISFNLGWWVVIPLAFGTGAFFLANIFFPSAVYFTEVKRTAPKLKKPSATGNDDLDEALSDIFENKKELVRLCDAIASPKIRMPLKEILRVLDQISQYVSEHPDKVKSLRQFCNYYLPTTVSFLGTYEELESKPDKGDNITATLAKIEEVTAKLVDVFKREYDDLFSDKAMDIEAEATVMKAIIKEGESIL